MSSVIDRLRSETQISFDELAKEEGVSSSTIRLWASSGFRGVKLESYRLGNLLRTSREAFARFLAASNSEQPAN